MAKNAKKVNKAQIVEQNFESFQRILPSLIGEHNGRYALMRDREVCAFFDTARDAMTAAGKLYEDDNFSVQCVTQQPINLGYWSSHA